KICEWSLSYAPLNLHLPLVQLKTSAFRRRRLIRLSTNLSNTISCVTNRRFRANTFGRCELSPMPWTPSLNVLDDVPNALRYNDTRPPMMSYKYDQASAWS